MKIRTSDPIKDVSERILDTDTGMVYDLGQGRENEPRVRVSTVDGQDSVFYHGDAAIDFWSVISGEVETLSEYLVEAVNDALDSCDAIARGLDDSRKMAEVLEKVTKAQVALESMIPFAKDRMGGTLSLLSRLEVADSHRFPAITLYSDGSGYVETADSASVDFQDYKDMVKLLEQN